MGEMGEKTDRQTDSAKKKHVTSGAAPAAKRNRCGNNSSNNPSNSNSRPFAAGSCRSERGSIWSSTRLCSILCTLVLALCCTMSASLRCGLTDEGSSQVQDLLFLDITPSMSLETGGGNMT